MSISNQITSFWINWSFCIIICSLNWNIRWCCHVRHIWIALNWTIVTACFTVIQIFISYRFKHKFNGCCFSAEWCWVIIIIISVVIVAILNCDNVIIFCYRTCWIFTLNNWILVRCHNTWLNNFLFFNCNSLSCVKFSVCFKQWFINNVIQIVRVKFVTKFASEINNKSSALNWEYWIRNVCWSVVNRVCNNINIWNNFTSCRNTCIFQVVNVTNKCFIDVIIFCIRILC